MVIVKFVALYNDVILPKYAKEDDSGADVRAYLGHSVSISPGNRALIPTGLKVAYIDPGYEIQVRPRSGMSLKYGLTVLNSPGTIDNGYRGELGVIIINHNTAMTYEIKNGDRIAQIVVCPVVTAEFSFTTDIVESNRSDGGFGHTGYM